MGVNSLPKTVIRQRNDFNWSHTFISQDGVLKLNYLQKYHKQSCLCGLFTWQSRSMQLHSRRLHVMITIIIIVINEYYYSAMESKKLQKHLTEQIKPTTVSCRIRTGAKLPKIKRAAEEQFLEPSFEGDQRWWRDDVRWHTVLNASCTDSESASLTVTQRVDGTCSSSDEAEWSRQWQSMSATWRSSCARYGM